jgi:hypothetical protein
MFGSQLNETQSWLYGFNSFHFTPRDLTHWLAPVNSISIKFIQDLTLQILISFSGHVLICNASIDAQNEVFTSNTYTKGSQHFWHCILLWRELIYKVGIFELLDSCRLLIDLSLSDYFKDCCVLVVHTDSLNTHQCLHTYCPSY